MDWRTITTDQLHAKGIVIEGASSLEIVMLASGIVFAVALCVLASRYTS